MPETGPQALPLQASYEFGIQHNLSDEIESIRTMSIEWDRSYTSSVRRGYIVDLLQKKGLFEEFKNTHWPNGNTREGKGLTNRYLRIMEQYKAFLENDGATEPDEDELADQAFAAESDLRDFLAQNLSCLEEGLRLFDDGGRSGVEFPVDSGRIDILAIDHDGKFVVIEMKLSRGRNKTLGQLLYYMGWVDRNLGNGPCRGVIVARDISDDLIVACSRVSGVSLYRYRLQVSLERITK